MSQNRCEHLQADVPWQTCCFCSLNPSRPPLEMLLDPNAQAAFARQTGGGCNGCGDPGGLSVH